MIDKKIIWHVSSNRCNSAVTEYALSSIRALEKRGFDNIFSPLKGSPAEERARLYGLRCLPLRNFHLSSLLSFCSLGSRLRPSYIISYGGPETFLSKMLRKKTKKLIRFRGQGVTATNEKYKGFLRYSYNHLDSVIVPGKNLHSALEKIDCHDHIKSIPLGIDTDFFSPSGNWVPPLKSQHRPEVLIFGRVDPVKGHSLFIEIFDELLGLWKRVQKTPMPYLHIVGHEVSTPIDSLKKQVSDSKNLTLGEDVCFTSKTIDDPKSYLSRASLGVVCSLGSEEICRVSQEFLSCGTPIFVSGVGALDECLFTPDAGRSYRNLGRQDTVESLMDLILKSQMESVEERLNRSEQARNRFCLEKMGAQLESHILSPTRGLKDITL